MANQAAGVKAEGNGITRREFLYYIWGASLALLGAQGTGLLIWFLIPQFREGEFGGIFPVPIEDLPGVNDEPGDQPEGRFWLVNLDSDQPNDLMYTVQDETESIKGVAAIYKVCTHLGCIYAWTPANGRFECPCHGSKYRLDGRRIESPAPRSLDRFKMYAVDADGNRIAESPVEADGFYGALVLPDNTAALEVDTGDRVNGPETQLLCEFAGNCP